MGGKMTKLVKPPASSLITRVQSLVLTQPKERTSPPKVSSDLGLCPFRLCLCRCVGIHMLLCACVHRCRQNKLKIF